MLSLTVVPAGLHAITGLSAAVILKAVYPALLALFPVLVYSVGCRVVSPRAAYLAGLVIVAQAPFIEQLPAIARQEAALLEFGALLAVMADRELHVGTRRALIAVFGTGVVVSHYSTAYVTIALLGLGLVVGVALAAIRRGVRLLPMLAYAFIVVGAAAAVWYGPVTRSYANAGDTIQAIAADGLHVLPGAAGKGPLDAYLRGNTAGEVPARTYERDVAARYAKDRAYVVPLDQGADPRYALRDDPVPTAGSRSARQALDVAATVIQQLVNVLAAAGALTLALRRRSSPTARMLGALGAGALAILAVARISGTIAASYNLERLDVQMLAVTGIGLAFLADRLAARALVGRILVGLFALGLLVAVGVGSGLGTTLTRYRRHRQPVAVGRGRRAVRDHAGRARRGAMAGSARRRPGRRSTPTATRSCACSRSPTAAPSFLTAVTPRTLDHHAWVYASRTNWVDGRARDAIGQDLVDVRVPAPLPGRVLRPAVREPAGGGVQPVITTLLHPVRRALAVRQPATADPPRVLAFPRDPNPYLELLYGELRRRGADVAYIGGATPSQSLNALLLPAELALGRLRGARVLHVHWLFPFGLAWAGRRRALRWIPDALLAALLVTARLAGLRVVWTVHNVVPHAPVFGDDARARRRLLAASDLVIVHAEPALTELRRRVGEPPRQVRVIPLGPFAAARTADPAARDASRRVLRPRRAVQGRRGADRGVRAAAAGLPAPPDRRRPLHGCRPARPDRAPRAPARPTRHAAARAPRRARAGRAARGRRRRGAAVPGRDDDQLGGARRRARRPGRPARPAGARRSARPASSATTAASRA